MAQFKSTVAVLPRSTVVLAGAIPFDEGQFIPETSIGEELKELVTK